MQNLIISMRPRQWIKNLFVFAALLFSTQFLEISACIKAITAFGLFCLMSSSIYIFNDVIDRREDREHPVKCRRPIAAGRLSIRIAVPAAILMASISVVASLHLSMEVAAVLLAFAFLQILYSTILRRAVILDVMTIATGFVLRTVAGGLAIQVNVSSWLLVTTFFVALFMAVNKRRGELRELKTGFSHQRRTLSAYSTSFLQQLSGITATAAGISYALYTFNSSQPDLMVLSIPPVLYGLFRYSWLVEEKGIGSDPSDVLLKDVPLAVSVLVWMGIFLSILLWARSAT